MAQGLLKGWLHQIIDNRKTLADALRENARMCGAYIGARDLNQNEPLPDNFFDPSPYHEDQRKLAVEKLREWEAMGEEAKHSLYESRKAEKDQYDDKRLTQYQSEKAYLEGLLSDAEKALPNIPKIWAEMAQRFLDDLRDAITENYSDAPTKYEFMQFGEWCESEHAGLIQSAFYHAKFYAEECARQTERKKYHEALEVFLKSIEEAQ